MGSAVGDNGGNGNTKKVPACNVDESYWDVIIITIIDFRMFMGEFIEIQWINGMDGHVWSGF